MTYIKLNHDFAKFIDPAYYAEIIKKEDDATCVLKLHLLCERFLNVYLEERVAADQRDFFEVGKAKDKQILKYFYEKLQLAVALGLPVELAKPLKSINGMRNNFAHEFDAKLEDKTLKAYFQNIDAINNPVLGVFNNPVETQCVAADGVQIHAKDSPTAAFTIATYVLMNKAGAWLVDDLKRRGKLNIG